MDATTVLLLVLMAGAVGAVWYLVQRYRRTTASADGMMNAKELEAFIAAYRSGRVDPRSLSAETPTNAETPAGSPPKTASVTAPLLRPEVKLAYLSLRAGMRDHHVFPNIRLADLGHGNTQGQIDLLVCNPQFVTVAAIDVTIEDDAGDDGKAGLLQNAGIRYLRLRARQMPRPAQLHALIYRK